MCVSTLTLQRKRLFEYCKNEVRRSATILLRSVLIVLHKTFFYYLLMALKSLWDITMVLNVASGAKLQNKIISLLTTRVKSNQDYKNVK